MQARLCLLFSCICSNLAARRGNARKQWAYECQGSTSFFLLSLPRPSFFFSLIFLVAPVFAPMVEKERGGGEIIVLCQSGNGNTLSGIPAMPVFVAMATPFFRFALPFIIVFGARGFLFLPSSYYV